MTAEQSEWEAEVKEWMGDLRFREFVIETSVSNAVDKVFHITEMFTRIGWQSILQFKGVFYPDLVREFYANIRNKKRSVPSVTSMVRGVKVVVSPGTLSRHFDIPNYGDILSIKESTDEQGNKTEVCNVDPTWSRDEATTRLDVPVHYSGKKEIYYLKHFAIEERILAYILAHNVDPKASDSHLARFTDLYHIDCMMNGQQPEARVALAATIIANIRKRVHNIQSSVLLAYPVLISQLLVKLGVDTSKTEVWETTGGDRINKPKLESFGYHWNGHWFSNPWRMNKQGLNIRDPGEDEEEYIRDQVRQRRGIEVPRESTAASTDQPDQPTQRRRMPSGGHPLPQATFQTQVMQWIEQSEQNHNALATRVDTIDAKLQTILDNQAQLLAFHGHPPPPPP